MCTKIVSAKTGCNVCGVHKNDLLEKKPADLELSRKAKPVKNIPTKK